MALTHFFIRKEMARHYAAFGDVARPTFDLIELNGAGLNAMVLASGAQVSSLLASGALPEQVPRVRQRLASARGQSLVNNAALGSSLLELDAHWWGGQIAQATRQLIESSRSSMQTIVNIREAYSTIMANNLNRIIKRLTVITIFMSIPTIVSSIYGMNIMLPGQDNPLMFWVLGGVVFGAIGLLGWIFWRENWF